MPPAVRPRSARPSAAPPAFVPMVAAVALATAPAAAQGTPAQPAPRPATDSTACTAGAPATPGDDRGSVLVTLPGTEGEAPAQFRAWSVELRLDGAPAVAGTGRPGAGAAGRGGEVHLTRAADAAAVASSRLRTSGQRLATVWVAADSAAGGLRVRLTNVTVAAQRLAFPEPQDALDEQAAGLAAEVCQLAADRADAARRLAELEALDRRKLAAAFELARLGDQGRVLDARLAAARRRLTLLALRAARAARPTEELTLRAERAEVLAGDDARAVAPPTDLPSARPRR